MKVTMDGAMLLKVMNRHKARTLADLKQINCPTAYIDIIRNRLDYLRNDIIQLGKTENDKGETDDRIC